jgi:hypothetical protein
VASWQKWTDHKAPRTFSNIHRINRLWPIIKKFLELTNRKKSV